MLRQVCQRQTIIRNELNRIEIQSSQNRCMKGLPYSTLNSEGWIFNINMSKPDIIIVLTKKIYIYVRGVFLKENNNNKKIHTKNLNTYSILLSIQILQKICFMYLLHAFCI